MDINVNLLQWSLTFLIKKASGSSIINENISNKELAEELNEPIITKFKERKIHSSFKDNIWDVDLADMQLTSKFIKGIRFYYVLFIFSVNKHGLIL